MAQVRAMTPRVRCPVLLMGACAIIPALLLKLLSLRLVKVQHNETNWVLYPAVARQYRRLFKIRSVPEKMRYHHGHYSAELISILMGARTLRVVCT